MVPGGPQHAATMVLRWLSSIFWLVKTWASSQEEITLICGDTQSIIKNYESYVINWTGQLAIQQRRLKIAFDLVRALSLKPMKRQAPSLSVKRRAKLQASSQRSVKHQAINVVPVIKRQAWRLADIGQETEDRCTPIKFYGTRRALRGLFNQDEITFCMCCVKENLMWTKLNFCSVCNFKLNSKKSAWIVVTK